MGRIEEDKEIVQINSNCSASREKCISLLQKLLEILTCDQYALVFK